MDSAKEMDSFKGSDSSESDRSDRQERIDIHKKELLGAFDLLVQEGVEDELILFPYLMLGIIWSEELHLEVLELGFKLWLDAYQGSNFAWLGDPTDIANDPENPINSPLFDRLTKLRERVKQIKESNQS